MRQEDHIDEFTAAQYRAIAEIKYPVPQQLRTAQPRLHVLRQIVHPGAQPCQILLRNTLQTLLAP